MKKLIKLLELINKNNYKYNIIDEGDQLRIELFKNNLYINYIIITEDEKIINNILA